MRTKEELMEALERIEFKLKNKLHDMGEEIFNGI
jgi:hypothetical protein